MRIASEDLEMSDKSPKKKKKKNDSAGNTVEGKEKRPSDTATAQQPGQSPSTQKDEQSKTVQQRKSQRERVSTTTGKGKFSPEKVSDDVQQTKSIKARKGTVKRKILEISPLKSIKTRRKAKLSEEFSGTKENLCRSEN